jgi:hypothetical protein
VLALQTWLKLTRIGHGPLFRRLTGNGKGVGPERLTDKQVARLVKRAALAGDVRADLPDGEREEKFSGHSLRAGLASSARYRTGFARLLSVPLGTRTSRRCAESSTREGLCAMLSVLPNYAASSLLRSSNGWRCACPGTCEQLGRQNAGSAHTQEGARFLRAPQYGYRS